MTGHAVGACSGGEGKQKGGYCRKSLLLSVIRLLQRSSGLCSLAAVDIICR